MTPTPEQQRPDQSAPDFEEARRRLEEFCERWDGVTAPAGALKQDIRALLNEREAREEAIEWIRAVKRAAESPRTDAISAAALVGGATRVLAALPATESSQAEQPTSEAGS